MRRLGDVSGDAACAGGRWMAVCKGRFPRVISLMDVCVSNGVAEDVEAVSRDLTTQETMAPQWTCMILMRYFIKG